MIFIVVDRGVVIVGSEFAGTFGGVSLMPLEDIIDRIIVVNDVVVIFVPQGRVNQNEIILVAMGFQRNNGRGNQR